MSNEAAESNETPNTSEDGAQAVANAVAESRPDWLLDRYMTDSRSVQEATAEQAKGYNEIRGKLGAFTGAPEAYEFVLSEELTGKGVELSTDDPLIASFTDMAKESGMNQDMANKLVNMFVESQYAEGLNAEEAETTRHSEEMKELGENAQRRLDNIGLWTKANFDPEMAEFANDAMLTANGVKFIEALIGKTRNAPLQNEDGVNTELVSDEEMSKLQFALDDNGNRKMSVDPEYRKMVEGKQALKHGLHEHNVTVGG